MSFLGQGWMNMEGLWKTDPIDGANAITDWLVSEIAMFTSIISCAGYAVLQAAVLRCWSPMGASDSGAVRFCLGATVAVPILYFGTQLVASPFYPGYSFLRQVASLLGSPNSRHPEIFNAGAIITGVALIAGGYGMYHALRNRRVSPVLSCLAALSMAVVGGTTIQAGIFPLPDHRHTAFGFLVIFLIVLPLILLLALWSQSDARGVRAFLVACCFAVLLIAPLMSHLIVIPGAGAGLLQRIFAAVTFLPIGVVGWKLRYCATQA